MYGSFSITVTNTIKSCLMSLPFTGESRFPIKLSELTKEWQRGRDERERESNGTRIFTRIYVKAAHIYIERKKCDACGCRCRHR